MTGRHADVAAERLHSSADGDIWTHRVIGPSVEHRGGVELRWRLPVSLLASQPWMQQGYHFLRRKVTAAGVPFRLTAVCRSGWLCVSVSAAEDRKSDDCGYRKVTAAAAPLRRAGAGAPERAWGAAWVRPGGSGDLRLARVVAVAEVAGPSSPFVVLPGSLVVEVGVMVHRSDTVLHAQRVQFRSDSRLRCGAVGLRNAGSRCYLNALLQLIFHLQAFRSAVVDGSVKNREGAAVRQSLKKVFVKMATEGVAPDAGEIGESLGLRDANAEHDVHEVLLALLDCVGAPECTAGDACDSSAEGSLMALLAGERLQKVHCFATAGVAVRTEPFRDVQLCVSGCADVHEAISKELRKELLTGSNQYDTGDPDIGLQDAERECLFKRFPAVLFLHLRRFQYDITAGSMRKVTSRFSYTESLELSQHLAPEHREGPLHYRLYGVIVHYGDGGGGHYSAYVRRGGAGGGGWTLFDDEAVTAAEPSEATVDNFGGDVVGEDGSVLSGTKWWLPPSRSAYLLVYVDRTRWAEIVGDGAVQPQEKQALVPGPSRRVAECVSIRVCTPAALRAQDRIRSTSSPVPGGVFYFTTSASAPADTALTLTVPRSGTWDDLRAMLAATGVPPFWRLWRFKRRANHTFRPQEPVVRPTWELYGGDEPLLGTLLTGDAAELYLMLEDTGGRDDLGPDTILLVVKLYDWSRPALSFLSTLLVRRDETVAAVAGRAADARKQPRSPDLLVFEEVCPADTWGPIEHGRTLADCGLESGDVLVVQTPPPDGARLGYVPAWLDHTRGRVAVEFVPRKGSKGHASRIRLDLHTSMTYLTVCSRLCAAADGGVRPDCVRIGAPSSQDADWRPFTLAELQSVPADATLKGQLAYMLSAAGGGRVLAYDVQRDADRGQGAGGVVVRASTSDASTAADVALRDFDPDWTFADVCDAVAAELCLDESAEVIVSVVADSWTTSLHTVASTAPLSDVLPFVVAGRAALHARAVPALGAREAVIECVMWTGVAPSAAPFMLVLDGDADQDALALVVQAWLLSTADPELVLLEGVPGSLEATALRGGAAVAAQCSELWERRRFPNSRVVVGVSDGKT